MKVTSNSVFDILSRLRIYFQRDNSFRHYASEKPFRSELYNSDQLNRHGKVVAATHKLLKRPSSDQLLKRLDANEVTLLDVRHLLVESIRSDKTITPGAEWLLDNFYLIEEQVVIARKHLPKGYSEALPCLSEGLSACLPRVYDIVVEIISHSDGRVDDKSLSGFIASYQSQSFLTIGELWAIPIMLRLAVIENLRRVAGQMALDMIDQNMADYWADKMMLVVKEEPGNLILTIADMARTLPVLESPFVAAFTRKLQGKGPSLALPLSWMEQQLAGIGSNSSDLVRLENQKQAVDQVSVRNSIGTLRFIGATDWKKFVENLSIVESILQKDGSGKYPLMDFATRDHYRHVVESVAHSSKKSEPAIAQLALDLSKGHEKEGVPDERLSHVGYYLVDKGIHPLERAAKCRFSIKEKISRYFNRMPVFVYIFSILFLTLCIASGMVLLIYSNGLKEWWQLAVMALLFISASSQFSVAFVNWLATLFVSPRLLPRMDFSSGIPPQFRTLVIVPSMLNSISGIDDLLEALEIRYLANKGANLHFGLLTDFTDAKSEEMPDDGVFLLHAQTGIQLLNRKYPIADGDVFFLFHRPRTWNQQERQWMGYERKRGKLAALHAFLRGKEPNTFTVVEGKHKGLTDIKYIITLDSDTQLPRESAWKFIATMAHPLNRPVYSIAKKRVTEGYAILQPRVASSLPKTSSSLFLRLQGDVSGIDPYTKVSSDVYQDLFGEGSFIGKGIYDVDVFELAVEDAFQENRILSHDLLEGCYARSGLVSDVFLYEENPSQYLTTINRHTRWIRGDWQIGAWMLPFITDGNKHLRKNKLSILSRWKISDNLRRSLIPVSLLSLLLCGWFFLPYPCFWTVAVSLLLLFPPLATAIWNLLHKPKDLTVTAHVTEVAILIRDNLFRFLFSMAVLPFEAFKFTKAIFLTNWRMLISRKKLLEWAPFAATPKNLNESVFSVYRKMWVAPVLAITTGFLLIYYSMPAIIIASPFLVLWWVSPAIAYQLSKPQKKEPIKLSEEQTDFLAQAARKTWAYFEDFVIEAENWLPPDNFQEDPKPVIAHRTSPTNMGLSLLSNLVAYDFGYINNASLLQRCANSMTSMKKLERYKGHFYNWYDTLSLLPLTPRYVSTVDSGNLCGHLMTLRQGVISLSFEPIIPSRLFESLKTVVDIVNTSSKGSDAEIIAQILTVVKIAAGETDTIIQVNNKLERVQGLCEMLETPAIGGAASRSYWSNKLLDQVKRVKEENSYQITWASLLPVPQVFPLLLELEKVPTWDSIQDMGTRFFPIIEDYESGNPDSEHQMWLQQLKTALPIASERAQNKLELTALVAADCEEMSDVSYDFLFEKSTSLVRIGYNVEEQRKDDSYYDLLASEARLGIFVAIAQGKLPQECWFALGRLLTNSGGDPILLSWSGSMFEYLMPHLVMPVYENTLIYQTAHATVKRQIEYAYQNEIPWGISESAYNMVDANMNFQYRAFGIPGLGLMRGLEEDLVVAPYASMLALMVAPSKSCRNLIEMEKSGFTGRYGFYEAIDYTASRQPRGKEFSVVQSYMVHHQGMSLLSIAYVLLNRPMQQRFSMELRFQATLLLLQEKIPRATLFYAHTPDLIEKQVSASVIQIRSINTPHTLVPEVQLLSNGSYQVMVSNSGGGYSRWNGIALTRWREDATLDDHGIFCYIKDMGTGKFWSNTYQPTLHPPKGYQAIFSQGHVEFRRLDYGIETKTEIVISPEDDTELRRIRITNRTLTTKILQVTSYAEIVLASQSSDESHPAFSNLFVETLINKDHKAIFTTRRARSEEEKPPWAFHHMNTHGVKVDAISYESDRMAFIGRGRNLSHPVAIENESLQDSQGAVLDPICSIRYQISVKPNQTATIDLIYGIADTKIDCENLLHKYGDSHLKNRAFELSWTHSQVLLRQINATELDAQLYDRLASAIIYTLPYWRTDPAVIKNNFRGQSALWSHSVSGDLPIVLLQLFNPESIELVRQLVQAHTYWQLKGLSVDLVIWNEVYGSYRQLLQDEIPDLFAKDTDSSNNSGRTGKIYIKTADQLSIEDKTLFESVARVILSDNKGSLADQLNRHQAERILPPLLDPSINQLSIHPVSLSLPDDLLYFNGLGGFSKEGTEYKMTIRPTITTPAPWVNVMANSQFGTVVAESGAAYTWAENAHEYRLTPWSNDPVSNKAGEAIYIRDEESGYFWSPSSYPATGKNNYIVTHGIGYSQFMYCESGIQSEMCVFVDKALPVKCVVLKVKNVSGFVRKLSATGYIELILGDLRSKTNMHILSELDEENGTLYFRNRYNAVFADRVAFFKVSGGGFSYTADRNEFVGRNRNLSIPAAMNRKKLSGRTGAVMDPCGALQVKFDLEDGAEKEVVFMIGNEKDISSARKLVHLFSHPGIVKQSYDDVKKYWKNITGALQVTTPDKSLDVLVNGWLTYQTLSCRIFGRSGFYQSGGAFGFRDQLQDSLALLYSNPELAKKQILLCSSRQFAEGDVQHWWHPPEGRGVRTRCSDDLLWLPFAVIAYLQATGDHDLLKENTGFLSSRVLYPEEDSFYDLPGSSNKNGTLYEHCVLAITKSFSFGVHGLPLIGSGDWNDGMDKVGNKGKGESIWLGFFLYKILSDFSAIATANGDMEFGITCRKEALLLQKNIEAKGWDGEWYLRAYFDDGSALGSNENTECKIDAIAQSWAVLSGAATLERQDLAMKSLDQYLVKRELKVIQLLDPPFNAIGINPGYIKGYLPGVRENGGQYTHAAIWAMMAFSAKGDRTKTWELFQMVNPILHATDATLTEQYKVEPYVMAADVYTNENHKGRGGWTWYTGSSGWMYQFLIGSFLGMKKEGDTLVFKPSFPLEWPFIEIGYQFGNSYYKIKVFQAATIAVSYWKNGPAEGEGNQFPLIDNGDTHYVEVYIAV